MNIETSKRYEIGFIPHYKEINDIRVQTLAEKNSDIHLIDLRQNPMQVLHEIAACETVISSSLHGLIMADSFRIPNRWGRLGRYTGGNTLFKYWDYYSNYNVKITPLILEPDIMIEAGSIKENYQISDRDVTAMKERLYASWPFSGVK